MKFADGAHTKWHYHTGQQLLVGTQGTGFVEFRGLPDVTLQEDDRVNSPVCVWHRHGAAPGESLIHLAATTGEIVWVQDDPCGKRSSSWVASAVGEHGEHPREPHPGEAGH